MRKYLNEHKVPQIFHRLGRDHLGRSQHYPWTIGWQPNYQTEGAHLRAAICCRPMPNAKVAVLYQNDDSGKRLCHGLQGGLGAGGSEG